MAVRQGTDNEDLLYSDRPGSYTTNVNGLLGNDRIWGGNLADYLSGGDGNDFIRGREDNDNLIGGSGNDVLVGGPGNDIIDGGAGNDRLYSAAGDGTFREGKNIYRGIFTQDTGWIAPSFTREVADVNGDGRADIVAFGAQGVYTALARADGTFSDAKLVLTDQFSEAQDWTNNNRYPLRLGDINGDGRADIVGFGGGEVYSALSKGDGTFLPSKVALSGNFTRENGGWDKTTGSDGAGSAVYPRYLADVNGDGRADIVGFGTTSVGVALAKTNGTFSDAKFVLNNFTEAQGWSDNDKFLRLLGDINGDGRADIVGFGADATFSALGKADGTFEPAKSAINEFSQKQGWSNPRFPRSLGDVNGDGWADIVGFGGGGLRVALSKGDGTFEVVNKTIVPSRPSSFTVNDGWPDNNSHPRQVADVNGDGLADIVGFGGAGVVVALANDVGGSDRLLGGDGNDTLVGGVGTKEATGGSGSDRFVLNPLGSMTIKDFTRDNDLSDGDQGDKIDVGGLQTQVDDQGAQLLSFKFLNANTQINAGTQTIAVVEGFRIDSRDLARTDSLKTLTADEVADINKLVQKWADGYAGSVGDQVSEIDLSRIKLTPGEIKYANNTVIPVANMATSKGVFRNNSTATQLTTFTFADQTNWSGSYQFSKGWKFAAKVGGKIGNKSVFGVKDVYSTEINFEINFEVGTEEAQTEAWTNQTGGSRLNQTAITTSAPANAVTIVEATISGQKFDSSFTLPIFIEGTVDVDLLKGDDNDINALPIGAILQYYNPAQFQPTDPNNIGYYDLPNGDYLSYGNTTKAIMTGQAKQADLLTANVKVESIFDNNLSNPAATPEFSGNLNNKDRFWLALGSLPAQNPPAKISNFTSSQDQIGIVAPGIDGREDLILGSRLVDGVTIGTISYGSRVLAELSGIDATKLTTNNFVFSTTGSIFDNSLITSGGSYENIVQTPL